MDELNKKSTLSPEIQTLLNTGSIAQREFGKLYRSIGEEDIRSRLNRVMELTDIIVKDVLNDAEDAPKIKKYLDTTVPDALRILNEIDRAAVPAQELIHELDAVILSAEQQYDGLFANDAMNLDLDLKALNSVLTQQGLGSNRLDFNNFMKDFNNRKGSNNNG